jgi:hypothetical protein
LRINLVPTASAKYMYVCTNGTVIFLGPLFGLPEIGEKRPRFPLH